MDKAFGLGLGTDAPTSTYGFAFLDLDTLLAVRVALRPFIKRLTSLSVSLRHFPGFNSSSRKKPIRERRNLITECPIRSNIRLICWFFPS